MMDRPPCWQDGKKQNPCALAHDERVVHGHTDLRADWLGWKQRGRYLVAPDGQRRPAGTLPGPGTPSGRFRRDRSRSSLWNWPIGMPATSAAVLARQRSYATSALGRHCQR